MSLINHRWPSFRIFYFPPTIFLTISFEELKEKNYPTAAGVGEGKWKERMMAIEIKGKHYGWVGILIVVINIVTPSAPFDLDSPYSFSSRFLPHISHWLQLMILPNRRLRHFLKNLCLLSIKSFPIHFHYHFNL